MATVTYSVPDDVKHRFNETFADANKSAIVADLMRRAVEEHQVQRQREAAIDELLALRPRSPRASDVDIRAARTEGWP